jgi:hypothetical protein
MCIISQPLKMCNFFAITAVTIFFSTETVLPLNSFYYIIIFGIEKIMFLTDTVKTVMSLSSKNNFSFPARFGLYM